MIKRIILLMVVVGISAFGMEVRQVMRPERWTRGNTNYHPIQPIDAAAWIWGAGGLGKAGAEDKVVEAIRFTRTFEVGTAPLRFDISADERFVLFLDGQEIARGPHKGLVKHWYYQTYEVTGLTAGTHCLTALVYRMGDGRPSAVMTAGKGGFILKAEDPYDATLTTGRAAWQAERIDGTRMNGFGNSGTFGGSQQSVVTGCGIFDLTARGKVVAVNIVRKGIRANEVGVLAKDWSLFPTERPEQLNEWRQPGSFRAGRFLSAGETNDYYVAADGRFPLLADFNAVLKSGKAVTLPAGKKLRLAWDFGDYYSGYPEMEVSGGAGAKIRWGWAEGLYDAQGSRGDRNAFADKHFAHVLRDTFLPDGRAEATFMAPWWRSGRWCEVEIETAGVPLVIRKMGIREVRYPLAEKARFACDDASIAGIWQICRRGLENCMHETYMDCPYFEQQMYSGDTRVVMLITDALSGDARLNRFGVGIFDYARDEDGLVPMNFPNRTNQRSGTYSMCWVMMLGDYVRWCGADASLKARLPGMRHTLHALAQYENGQGLLENLPGWSFMDWVEAWDVYGRAPDSVKEPSAVINLLYAYALQSAVQVERAAGDVAMAEYWEAKKRAVGAAVWKAFYVDARGLLADNLSKTRFSEHAQCLALLSGSVPTGYEARLFEQLLVVPDLARMTVYFSHYLFETYAKYGRMDLFLKRLDLWREYVKMGLKTPLEAPGRHSRSDCHAWGSHPIYHLLTGVAGMRPAADGFGALEIAPCPGDLKWIRAALPTPKGLAEVDLQFNDGNVTGNVTIPEGMPATFIWRGKRQTLPAGIVGIRN